VPCESPLAALAAAAPAANPAAKPKPLPPSPGNDGIFTGTENNGDVTWIYWIKMIKRDQNLTVLNILLAVTCS
jgi:hypothetical protein